MRLTGLVLVMPLAACNPDKDVTVPTLDALPVDATDADTDADADSDSDTDADTDSDTDTDSDSDTDADTDSDADTDTGVLPCTISVSGSFPAASAVDIYTRTNVWFALSDNDPTASITVADAAGTVVSGASTVDGLLVDWEGDELLPSTAYQGILTYACGTEIIDFTTSDVGDPLALDPTGFVYSVDLSTGLFVKPLGIGTLLATQLGDADLLVSPTLVNATDIEFIGAIGENDVQNVCVPTALLPSASWSDPDFDLVSTLLPIDVGGIAVDVTDVEIRGSFASDASELQFGRLKGLLDTRNLGELLLLGTAPDAVCQLAGIFGVACEACADALPYCMAVWVDGLEAPNVPGTLVPRTIADIAADTNCP